MAEQEAKLDKGVRQRKRTAVGGLRNKLKIRGKLDPAYEYRIANDIDNGSRIAQLIDEDWEIVEKKSIEDVGDKRVDKPTSEGTPVKISVGLGTQAYLMRKRKEWYDDDKNHEQELIKIKEQQTLQKPDGTYGEFRPGKVENFKN